MALAEYYVDPTSGNDTTGDGSKSTPWKTVQKALDTITKGTNGDRINIKAGANDDVLTATLDITTSYGAPTVSQPLIFRGYTTDAGDGGIGGIDGDATYAIVNDNSLDYIAFIDLHLHNTGTTTGIQLDNYIFIINCEIENIDGTACNIDGSCVVMGCYFHDIDAQGINSQSGLYCAHNIFENGSTYKFTYAVYNQGGSNCVFMNNIFDFGSSSSSWAIYARVGAIIVGNVFYSPSGTGLACGPTSGHSFNVVMNNLIQGFGGAGGVGFYLSGTSNTAYVIGGNSQRYATNPITGPTLDYYYEYGDEAMETLTTDPLTDPGNGDFSPVNTGSIKQGALPSAIAGAFTPAQSTYRWRGAIEPEEPAGSGNQGISQGLHTITDGINA